jgi:hypothetical protein
VKRSATVGDDWGNLTSYADGREHGGVFGMNRLNHCPPIFMEGWRASNRGLVEAAVNWCDNFHDLSIFWKENEGYGGTRYNSLTSLGQELPDERGQFLWRSDWGCDFCTKGYDSFWLAYEQTGDPRMWEALEAQVGYATENVHASNGEARNIGDVADFVSLYEYTGEDKYRQEALRLFRELRPKLTPDNIFSQSGRPLVEAPPFIESDETGYEYPFAKPYILGYALAGLPKLLEYAPEEPKLREVVEAVAEFMAESQDPLGAWRYPHPRSSHMIVGQAMEHAGQLVNAGEAVGPEAEELDAIERVLRQRLWGWSFTGKSWNSMGGWEVATGAAASRTELEGMYGSPEERDFRRDYAEGVPGFGSNSVEGLVYFPRVLGYYLEQRGERALLAPPKREEPLGQVLLRLEP